MLEKNTFRSPYSPLPDIDKFLKETRTSFLYPTGWRHFLSIPATLADIVSYLKKENLLISGPTPASLRNDLPPIPCYICKWKNDITSSGTDKDPSLAIIKSLSEGLERLLTYERSFNLNSVYTTTSKKIINPFKKETYFKEQLVHDSLLGINTQNMNEYISFVNILTGESVSLPTPYLHWGEHKNDIHVSTTTNGTGAHTNRELATISAIHEYIERDAFLLHWLCKISPLNILLSSIEEEKVQTLITNIQAMGIDLYVLALNSNVGVPTFISCLFDYRGNTPVFVVAGATDAFNYENAIYGALTESINILQESLDNLKVVMKEKITPPFLNRKIGRKERILFWKGEWVRNELKWLISGETVDLDKIKTLFPEIKKVRKDNDKLLVIHIKKYIPGIEIFCYHVKSLVTTSLGLHITKVFIPQLLIFYLKEDLANVNIPRLSEVVGKEGDEMLAFLNPLPHPYP